MALPAGRDTDWIERTIQSKIGTSLTCRGGEVFPVFHSDPWSDPGAARVDESGAELTGWFETQFIAGGAGRRGSTLLQVDIWRRRGAEGDASADPYGSSYAQMADAICEVFDGIEPSGRQVGVFDVQEFSNPLVPTDTGECMMCINSRLDIGSPEDGPRRLPASSGYHRGVVRFRFRLIADAARGAFYT